MNLPYLPFLPIPYPPNLSPLQETNVPRGHLPLLDTRPRLALIPYDRVQHDLPRVRGDIALIALRPIIANAVRKDSARFVERRRVDTAADSGVTLEPMLGVLVPEVERAVTTGCAEGAVLRVEGDGVESVYVGDVALRSVAVTFEGKVGAERVYQRLVQPIWLCQYGVS